MTAPIVAPPGPPKRRPQSSRAKIEIFGVHGEYWCVSGDGEGVEGATLQPKLKGAIDAPVTTLWVPGAFGQSYVDFRWKRRDVVFTVTIADDGGDPEVWSTIDSRWRFSFDYVNKATIRYTTSDGYRDLHVVLLEEPKAYESAQWEGKDPRLFATSTITMTVAAELPFYVGESFRFRESGVTSQEIIQVPIAVDCDIPVWPVWTLTDQANWRLPDFSWGNQEYGTGIQDIGRCVEIPYLPPGAGCVADSDPRRQTLLASNRINLQGLWKGQDLLYPVAGGTYSDIPVQVSGAVNGWAFDLEIPQWYSRPWSRPIGLV
jgi:hypothetical protein